MRLAQLESVDLREIWKTEETFNNWLANEGINILAKELNFENVEIVETEAKAGDFYADIVAKVAELEDEKIIVIESQLTSTDHDHLGKLLTYSAVFNANYIIWLTPHVREEHRKAIDWLNDMAESSEKDVGFFLVRIELWRIDDSPIAPKFVVVSSPNNWAKDVKKVSSIPSEKALKSYKFLSQFHEYISNYVANVRPPRITAPFNYEFRLNTSKVSIRIGVNTTSGYLRIGFVFKKELFDNFKKHEEHLQKLFEGEEVRVESPESYKKYAYADIFKRNVNLYKEEQWNDHFKWLHRQYEKLKSFFEEHREELLNEG